MIPGPDRIRLGLALAALCLAVGCGPAPDSRMDPALNRLPLDAWIDLVQTEAGTVEPWVRVAAPYRSLVFHRFDHRSHLSGKGVHVPVLIWLVWVEVDAVPGEIEDETVHVVVLEDVANHLDEVIADLGPGEIQSPAGLQSILG